MLAGIAVCAALCLSTILYYVYKLCKTKTTFFKALGVPGPEPHPIFGNLLELYKKGRLDATEGWSSKYGDIVGYFHGSRPVLIIRDLELLKQIFISNFNSFTAREKIVEVSSVLPINAVRLSRVRGDPWRELRAITSPAFKSSKMKRAFPIIDDCTDEFLEIMEKKAQQESGGVEISDPLCRLSMEILLRFTMGAQLNAQSASKETELIMNNARGSVGQFAFSWLIFFNIVPLWDITKKLILFARASLFKVPARVFHDHIKELVRMRRAKGWTGNDDLLQQMFDAEEKTGADKNINADSPRKRLKITPFSTEANAGLFVVAGLETVASVLAFTVHLLARHQDVQEKLRAEVNSLIEKDGSITYDNIFTLQYLNQVVSESLRFYPPLPGIVTRRCEKDFEFNGFRIPKETNIEVPVRLIHHDPRYWRDPEVFNPDRFSPENKTTIKPMAYIPYGIGPRNCPASKFAEIKLFVILAKMVVKFKFNLCDEPEKGDINYVAPLILAVSDGGAWVRMEKI